MYPHQYPHHLGEDPDDVLARKRAGAKLGWFAHAGVYLLVNLGLIALSMASGRHWALFPALGWGLGLAVHGLAVFVLAQEGRLFQRMVHAERARIAQTRTPHSR